MLQDIYLGIHDVYGTLKILGIRLYNVMRCVLALQVKCSLYRLYLHLDFCITFTSQKCKRIHAHYYYFVFLMSDSVR